MSMRIICIFLALMVLYMGFAITGLALENIELRRELAKACQSARNP